jgi:hypothetical protein
MIEKISIPFVPAGLPWLQRNRYEWTANLGSERFFVTWDQEKRDDWNALRSVGGSAFHKLEGNLLIGLVEDLKIWIRNQGGEIPKAPGPFRG